MNDARRSTMWKTLTLSALTALLAAGSIGACAAPAASDDEHVGVAAHALSSEAFACSSKYVFDPRASDSDCEPSQSETVEQVDARKPLDVTFFVANDIHFNRPPEYPEGVQSALVQLINNADSYWTHGWPDGSIAPHTPFGAPMGVIIAGDVSTCGGDCALGTYFDELLDYRNLFESGASSLAIKYPVFLGLGNHDFHSTALHEDDEGDTDWKNDLWHTYLDRRYQNAAGIVGYDPSSRNYSWDWGTAHFVQLNTWAGDVPGGLDWLMNDLARSVGQSGRPVVLIQHYGWDSVSRDPRWWSDENRAALEHVIAPYNVAAMFTGHIHNDKHAILYDLDDSEIGPGFDVYRGSSGGSGGSGGFLAVHLTDKAIDVVHLPFQYDASTSTATFSASEPLALSRPIRGPRRAQDLALGKPATQSSTDYGGVASRAVDGDTDGVFGDGSVTHTNGNTEWQPWWQVDLGASQPVGSVLVYNRTDCCSQRLSDFSVQVSNDGVYWTSFTYSGTGGSMVPFLVDKWARYVRVRLNGYGILSLAEVEVHPIEDLALGKKATQSSTDWGGDASRAVDGNTDGVFGDNSVTHTSDSTEWQPWWQVDLGAVKSVSDIILYNRTDSVCQDNGVTHPCAERLHDFTLQVSADGTTWRSFPWSGKAGAEVEFHIKQPIQFVRVQLDGQGILSLAEVQVLAGPRNVAREASYAWQSSTDSSGWAGNAVDGNIDGYFYQGSVTMTANEPQPWWTVDLGAEQHVGNVVLWNRLDPSCTDDVTICPFGSCYDFSSSHPCSQRLHDFSILTSLDGNTWTTRHVETGIALDRYEAYLGAQARYIRVQLNETGVLSLAEVEVLAAP